MNTQTHKDFKNEIDIDYENFTYFSELRRLSQGQMLKRPLNELHSIKAFMLSNPKSVSELDHKNWLTNLEFSLDFTAHLNKLNQYLQSETQLKNIIFQIITEVPMKQKL